MATRINPPRQVVRVPDGRNYRPAKSCLTFYNVLGIILNVVFPFRKEKP